MAKWQDDGERPRGGDEEVNIRGEGADWSDSGASQNKESVRRRAISSDNLVPSYKPN